MGPRNGTTEQPPPGDDDRPAPEQAKKAIVVPLYVSRPPKGELRVPKVVADAVYIRDRAGLQRVDRTDIRMICADGNYVEIHVQEKRFVVRNSLREVLLQLNDDRFVQVNRHAAVNLERVMRVDADSVELDGQCVTLSRNFRAELIERMQVLSGR